MSEGRMSKRGLLNVASLLLTVGVAFAPSFASASSIILDGDFLDPIGTGNNLTPWSDWTDAGITRHPAPTGIAGNYASMPVGADLFQRFAGPETGTYVLTFDVRDEASWSASLTFTVQKPYGGPWNEILTTITIPSSLSFTKEQFTFDITQPAGTLSELAFSNSYDAQFPHNPPGTVIDIAEVSINSVPEPSTWAMMLLGLAGLSFIGYPRRKKDSAFAIPRGGSESGRLSTVVYTIRGEAIRIISARGAEPYEQRAYREQNR
jgi:hypothetical protein